MLGTSLKNCRASRVGHRFGTGWGLTASWTNWGRLWCCFLRCSWYEWRCLFDCNGDMQTKICLPLTHVSVYPYCIPKFENLPIFHDGTFTFLNKNTIFHGETSQFPRQVKRQARAIHSSLTASRLSGGRTGAMEEVVGRLQQMQKQLLGDLVEVRILQGQIGMSIVAKWELSKWDGLFLTLYLTWDGLPDLGCIS